MNNFNISVSIWVVIFSTVLRLVAAGFYLYVVRRAIQEVGIKNGLIRLRRQLLISSVLLLFVNTVGLTLLLVRPYANPEVYLQITNVLAVINSLAFLIDAVIKKDIYSHQYTVKNKKLHNEIAKLENKAKK